MKCYRENVTHAQFTSKALNSMKRCHTVDNETNFWVWAENGAYLCAKKDFSLKNSHSTSPIYKDDILKKMSWNDAYLKKR